MLDVATTMRGCIAVGILAALTASTSAQFQHAPTIPLSPPDAVIALPQSSPHGPASCARCDLTGGAVEASWELIQPLQANQYGVGAYAGPPRMAHLAEYRLRPGDQLRVMYLMTRRQKSGDYRLMPGDEVLIESMNHPDLLRGTLANGLKIQPDGTLTLRILGQIQAAGLTIAQLREVLNKAYSRHYEQPQIDVTPVRTNTLAEGIRAAVGGQSGLTQQAIEVTVTPDGHIRLPGIGAVWVQALSLSELKREINLRYAEVAVGIEAEPMLLQQAPHFVHVLGQVAVPDRIQLRGPTTVLGAIAAAGGHLPGGNLHQVVIFRRADDWRLISTVLDLNGAIRGKCPTPADEIWVRDGDVIIVPEKPIRVFDVWVRQVFTEGIYGVVPFSGIFLSVSPG